MNDNLNLMEGDIVNEETSIYNTTKTKETVKTEQTEAPKKNSKPFSLSKFIPKYQILIALFVIIFLTCLGLIIVAQQNAKPTHEQTENTVLDKPSPTPAINPQVIELAKKIEQFKKDTNESAVTKQLTPPALDLNLKF